MKLTEYVVTRQTLRGLGLIGDGPIVPFTDFVRCVPTKVHQLLWELGGGRQTAEATATWEYLYAVYVVTNAGDRAFQIEPDLVEMLRETNIPELTVEHLRTPFEGIHLDVPRGSFMYPANLISRLHITNVEDDRFRIVFRDRDVVHYISMAIRGDETIAQCVENTERECEMAPVPQQLKKEIRETCLYDDVFKSDIFRFAVNTILYITSPDADIKRDDKKIRELHQKLHGLKKKAKRRHLEVLLDKEKLRKVYIVGARERLGKEYNATLTDAGKKWELTKRVRVRGHWRSQAYGTNRSERRAQWIRPHWKGPTFAEMVRRGYVVR